MRSIYDLLSHEDDADEELRHAYWQTVEAAKQYMEGICYIEDYLLFTMLNKIGINCHDMMCPRSSVFGRVVYLGASKLNHTCEVHDRYVQEFHGRTYVIRALQDIEVKCTDDIMISYIPLMMNCKDRRNHLKEYYHFDCECSRCLTELRGPPTKHCKSRLAIEITNALDYGDPVEPKKRYPYFLKYYKKVENLPDNDFYKYRLITNMMYACIDTKNLSEAIYLGMRALSVSLSIPEMELPLDELCTLLKSAKWHHPRHPKFRDFLFFTKMALNHFEVSRGPDDFITREHHRTLRRANRRQKAVVPKPTAIQ